MRKIKTIDHITKTGKLDLGEDYVIVEDINDAEGIIIRSSSMPKETPAMRKIKTIDHITKTGKLDLGEDYVIVEDINDAEGIIIRSSSMHEMELPRGIAAVARAGAGFNNIDLGEDYVIVEDINDAEGIIIRSSSMHEMELPRGIAAVARAGAGFNNIPTDRFARQGVVVFNTPGANSNAVKELMVCLFLLASRDVLGGIKWCRDHEEDPDAYVHAEFNTPGANSNAVKELMVCLFLLASRDVLGGIKWCRDHEEDPDAYVHAEAAKKAFVGWEIKGKTVGVIGLGNVGSKVANALVDLGMTVYGYDPYIAVKDAWQLSRDVIRLDDLNDLCARCDYVTVHVPSDLGMTVYGYDPYIAVKDAWQLSRDVIRLDDLNDLCARCDYVTVHVPSEPDTWGLIGAEQIAAMPDGVTLFNYSRETLVDEAAVDAGLRSGKIRMFLTDFATPGVLKMPNTIVTPHAGAGTAEAEENCAAMAIEQLQDYLENGNITNSVNYPEVHMGVCRDGGRVAALCPTRS